jgi:hypothetical protein
MLNDDQKRLARFALGQMFTKKTYFDICTIDNVLEMANRR